MASSTPEIQVLLCYDLLALLESRPASQNGPTGLPLHTQCLESPSQFGLSYCLMCFHLRSWKLMGHFVVRPLVLGPLLVGPLVFGPLLTGPLVPPLAGEVSQAQPGAGLEDQHDPPTSPHQPKLGAGLRPSAPTRPHRRVAAQPPRAGLGIPPPSPTRPQRGLAGLTTQQPRADAVVFPRVRTPQHMLDPLPLHDVSSPMGRLRPRVKNLLFQFSPNAPTPTFHRIWTISVVRMISTV